MAAKQHSQPGQQHSNGGRQITVEKALVPLGTLVLGLLGGIFGTALSPLGEDLRERFFPTTAIVTGTVIKDGAGINANVLLDGDVADATALSDATDDWGGFGFERVATGSHTLAIAEDGGDLSYRREFRIVPGQREKELGDMDLAAAQPRLRPVPGVEAAPTRSVDAAPTVAAPAASVPELTETPRAASAPLPTIGIALPPQGDVSTGDANGGSAGEFLETPIAAATVWVSLLEPTFAAEPSPAASPTAGESPSDVAALAIEVAAAPIPEDARQAWMPADARRVSIQVDGPPDIVSRIERVTYTLPEVFNPSIVTRYATADGFRLSLDTGETTIAATIYFDDGTAIDREIPIVF